MAMVQVVRSAFARKHPVTGELREYKKGDIIADPDMLGDIKGTEHEAHGYTTHLADHHHAVFPFLPDDHPLKMAAAAAAPAEPPPPAPASRPAPAPVAPAPEPPAASEPAPKDEPPASDAKKI